jgi:hypothetical protein
MWRGTPGRTRTCDPLLRSPISANNQEPEFPSNIKLSDSRSYHCLVEACRKLLAFEALTIYKIIYSESAS